MKKLFAMFLFVFCVLTLAACGAGDQETTQPETEKLTTISTPFADLKIKESIAEHVSYEVVTEDPYTMTFKSQKDQTELFSVVFNGTGELLMGTLVGETENVVVYMNVPVLDDSSPYYAENIVYQDGINDIQQNLTADYNFVGDTVIEKEESSTFEIETPLVTLYYPTKWKDKVDIAVEETKVSFSNKGTPVFDLVFAECEGYLLGTYKETPIYIVDYPVENEEQISMQDDVNVMIQHLTEDADFAFAQ